MLNRDQQRLLGALGAAMAADALLDRLRGRGTLEGGCSTPQAACWINYNRTGVRLEGPELPAGIADAGNADASQTWRRMRPRVLVNVTWAHAATHGASLPSALRTELSDVRNADRDESRRYGSSPPSEAAGHGDIATTQTGPTRQHRPSGTPRGLSTSPSSVSSPLARRRASAEHFPF